MENVKLSELVHAIQQLHGETIIFKEVIPTENTELGRMYLDIVFNDGQKDIHRYMQAPTLLLAIDLYIETCTQDPLKEGSMVLNRKKRQLGRSDDSTLHL